MHSSSKTLVSCAAPPAQKPQGKTVAIVQSNYIPWKGYFDLINRVQEFILYDNVQFTKRDWRNRNRIKTPDGLLWLTIPVQVKGSYYQRICDARVSEPRWAREHWKTLSHNYSRTPGFALYREIFEELYGNQNDEFLVDINYRFLKAICGILGIPTTISRSQDYEHVGDRTERLLHLCRQTGARAYLSGPAAQAYLDEDLFRQEGIAVHYMDYSGYPEYRQRFPPFEHAVSILDLLFNEGPEATRYLKSFAWTSRS